MKHLMIAMVASLGLISAAAATSTTVTTGTSSGGAAVTTGTTSGTAVTTGGTSGTSGTVVIQPEVRTKVKQYVTTSKPKAATVPSGFTVRRGVALPEAVEIQTFPADVGVTGYRYAVVGNQTVLVNTNREIVEIID
jgi:hypothetical protein